MLARLKLAGLTAFAVACAVLAFPPGALAQNRNSTPEPYASIQSEKINYRGPGRETSYDLDGAALRIGLIVPLRGPEEPDGKAIVAAARRALEDDAAQGPLPGGRKLDLAVGDESGPSWGKTSSALIHLVLDEQAIAVITSANGSTAHLSEQVGNRIGVAVLTLASDKTTTQIDLPWIFRLAPSDTAQAHSIAKDIYGTRGFRQVLLVTENSHDGRLGGEAFLDAARALDVPQPLRAFLDPIKPDFAAATAAVRVHSPQAVIVWTSSHLAGELLRGLRAAGISLPVYLSQEAAQTNAALDLSSSDLAPKESASEAAVFTVGPAKAAPPAGFARRFQAATGVPPSPVAIEAYEAVRLVAQAVRESGPNRARLRDRIAGFKSLAGDSVTPWFDNEGNALGAVQLVRLR